VTQLMEFSLDRPTAKLGPRYSVNNESLARLVDELRASTGVAAQDVDLLVLAIAQYEQAAADEFLREHDHFRLLGQDNLRRYLPVPTCVRVSDDDSWFEIVARAAAAKSVGCRVSISAAPGVHVGWLQVLHDLTEAWAGDIEFVTQTDEELCEAIEWGGILRLRYAAADRVPELIRRAVIERYVHIADQPVLPIGRLELLNYLQEQSVCIDYHRYGNLGPRANEQRE
jgi:RHH-type transcriptional regulator, proline utilization regulon repressor / proline dehydrogenase / delta 1-pyrroline-5-carboxylate dehydrogenase